MCNVSHAGINQQQLLDLARHMAHMLSQHKACLQSLSSQYPDRAKSLALSALQLADHMPAPVKALGSHHIWRTRIQEALMRACVDLSNDWPMVLSVGKKLVPAYEMVYPKVSTAVCAIELPRCVDTDIVSCELQYHTPTEQCQSLPCPALN
jgi:hypothetical protein